MQQARGVGGGKRKEGGEVGEQQIRAPSNPYSSFSSSSSSLCIRQGFDKKFSFWLCHTNVFINAFLESFGERKFNVSIMLKETMYIMFLSAHSEFKAFDP